MSITQAEPSVYASSVEIQLATFYVGDLLLGIDIQTVQEINRQLNFTPVPHAPSFVQGVTNLRGEVVTIVDLHSVLDLPPVVTSRESRVVVVQSGGEAIGLVVDRIADVLTVNADDFDAPPANISGVDGRFFEAVHSLEQELLVILNVEEVLNK